MTARMSVRGGRGISYDVAAVQGCPVSIVRDRLFDLTRLHRRLCRNLDKQIMDVEAVLAKRLVQLVQTVVTERPHRLLDRVLKQLLGKRPLRLVALGEKLGQLAGTRKTSPGHRTASGTIRSR